MRFDMAILFVMFVLPVMLFQLVGSDGALAQSTYAVSARVPATCPKGYSPNLDTGLCPVTCPSNTAPNTKGECVPLPVVIEEQPSVLVTPKGARRPDPCRSRQQPYLPSAQNMGSGAAAL